MALFSGRIRIDTNLPSGITYFLSQCGRHPRIDAKLCFWKVGHSVCGQLASYVVVEELAVSTNAEGLHNWWYSYQ